MSKLNKEVNRFGTFKERKARFNVVKQLKEAGVSSKDIADALGIHQTTVSRYVKADTYDDHVKHHRELSKRKDTEEPTYKLILEDNTDSKEMVIGGLKNIKAYDNFGYEENFTPEMIISGTLPTFEITIDDCSHSDKQTIRKLFIHQKVRSWRLESELDGIFLLFNAIIDSLIHQDNKSIMLSLKATPKDGLIDENNTITKTSQKGLHEGWTRATFIVKEDVLAKLKDRAYIDRRNLKDVVSEAIEYYLNNQDKDIMSMLEKNDSRLENIEQELSRIKSSKSGIFGR